MSKEKRSDTKEGKGMEPVTDVSEGDVVGLVENDWAVPGFVIHLEDDLSQG